MSKLKIPTYIENKIPPSRREELERKIEAGTVMAEKKAVAFKIPYDGTEIKQFTNLMSCPDQYTIQDVQRQFLDDGVAVYVVYEEILGDVVTSVASDA